MSCQGTISKWKDDSGFGFIKPRDGGSEVFVHISAFLSRERRPACNDDVIFVLGHDDKGRARAEQVQFAFEAVQNSGHSKLPPIPFICAAIFILATIGAALVGLVPLQVPALYVGASVLAFILYGVDKSAAINNGWRAPEKTLHTVSIMGGWPGALVAQRVFHHKSKKISFQLIFWVTVVLNCAALAIYVYHGWQLGGFLREI